MVNWNTISKALSLASTVVGTFAIATPDPYSKPLIALGVGLANAAIIAIKKEVKQA